MDFENKAYISSFVDTSDSGNITFKNGGTINSIDTDDTFKTSGTVLIGYSTNTAETLPVLKINDNVIHTNGDTEIYGTLEAAKITLAETSGGKIIINN